MSLRIPCGARGTLAGVAVECRGIVVRSMTVRFRASQVWREITVTSREYLLASSAGRASLIEGSGIWSHATAVPAAEVQDAGDHCSVRGQNFRNPAMTDSTTTAVIVEVAGEVDFGHILGRTEVITSFAGPSDGLGIMRTQSGMGTEYMSGAAIAPEQVAAAFQLPYTPPPRWLSTSVLIVVLPIALLVIGSLLGLLAFR